MPNSDDDVSRELKAAHDKAAPPTTIRIAAVLETAVKMLSDWELASLNRPLPEVADPKKVTRVKSRMSGNYILPQITDFQFVTVWYALLEYKTSLESSLFLTSLKRSENPEYAARYGLEGDQAVFIDNAPDTLEDQNFYYETISRATYLVNEYLDRAMKLGLI